MSEDKNTRRNGKPFVRAPVMVTLRDVVFIVAGVVSIVLAWGLFGTQLSVAEEKLIRLDRAVIELKQELSAMETSDETRHKDNNKIVHELIRKVDILQFEIKDLQKYYKKK